MISGQSTIDSELLYLRQAIDNITDCAIARLDANPGIGDVAAAMTDGFSTAGSLVLVRVEVP